MSPELGSRVLDPDRRLPKNKRPGFYPWPQFADVSRCRLRSSSRKEGTHEMNRFNHHHDCYRQSLEIFRVLMGIQVLLFKLLLIWSQLANLL